MAKQIIQARFIQHIGTNFWLRTFQYSSDKQCKKQNYGCDAKIYIKTTSILFDNRWSADDFSPEFYPKVCDACGEPFGEKAIRQLFRERNYNTRTGSPEVGDLFYQDWDGYNYWDNQVGPNLIAVCPGGFQWNIDSRASNCGLPNDRLHRCWVRHGEVPNITVDKKGLTCKAGAGSIKTSNWHGFLRNGQFVT